MKIHWKRSQLVQSPQGEFLVIGVKDWYTGETRHFRSRPAAERWARENVPGMIDEKHLRAVSEAAYTCTGKRYTGWFLCYWEK